MRKMKLIFGWIAALVLVFALTGCSQTVKTSNEIMLDLESSGFTTEVSEAFNALAEVGNNADYDMQCTITNNAEFEKTNIYECNVVCENSFYEITCDLKVTYVKNDGWNFSGYEIANTRTKMKMEIPEERILRDISAHFAQAEKNVNVVEGSIVQTLDDSSIGCEVTATGELTQGILTEQCTINVSYIFTDKWEVYVRYKRDSYAWDVQALSGKKWLDSYKWSEGDFIYIASVDEANSTMMVGYRTGIYSSTIDGPYEEHGKPIRCRYELDEDCIKIKTGDNTLEIDPEMGIVMSGYMTYPEN